MSEDGSSSLPSAAHAYEHATHVVDEPRHRLDILDRPRWPAAPKPSLSPATAPSGAPVLRHRVESPVRLGFGFGFGFAAGQWVFRAAIALIAVGLLLGGLWQLFAAAVR